MSQPNHSLIWILNKDHVLANQTIVKQFFALYNHEDNFPDENERENSDVIRDRVLENSDKPNTNLIAYTINGEVRGGAILEYYSRSECCLLTYVFVHKQERGTGIARELIDTDKGIPGLLRSMESKGLKIRAVFFESNNPFLTAEGNDSIPPSERLKIFKKLGAKRVDISYVQPSLGEGQGLVTNLYLCTFPKLNREPFFLEIKVILCFLVEFYFGLEALKGEYNQEYDKAERVNNEPPKFETIELNNMYASLIQNEYAHFGLSYLQEIPLLENPRLSFERASICFEILVDETYYHPKYYDQLISDFPKPKNNNENELRVKKNRSEREDEMWKLNNNGEYCVITHSFETDLFAYGYQADPPYYTRCFNFPIYREVTIRFPQKLDFVSEGRRETMYVLENESNCDTVKKIKRKHRDGSVKEEVVKEIKLKAFLNYSYFYKSEIRVWHLVFSSEEGNGINEIDIIKLMKFFSGSQESRTEHDKRTDLQGIKFIVSDNPEEELNIIELFEKISGIHYSVKNAYLTDNNVDHQISIHNLKTGIIEIDTDYCQFLQAESEIEKEKSKEVLIQLFRNLKINEEGKKVSAIDVQKQYKDNDEAEYVFEAFCGITLGIFDYLRMGYEEVSDTLVPRSATENSFLTINRGVLSSFGYGDDVLGAAYNTIGINPYLLIPSAVLAHNEYISIDAFKRSMEALEDFRRNEKTVDINKLELRRKQVQNLLNIDFLPNVFQYPTEQDLYEYGIMHRGITERNIRTKANLKQIDDIISESNAHLNHKYQFWVNVLLMVISIFQIYDVVVEFIAGWVGVNIDEFSIWIKFFVLLFLIIVCYLISLWLYKRSAFDTSKTYILKKK